MSTLEPSTTGNTSVVTSGDYTGHVKNLSDNYSVCVLIYGPAAQYSIGVIPEG